MDKRKLPSCKVSAGTQGFSLVELAIAIAIIGILIGGVLAGRSMIRASELRDVASDFTRYTAALNAFSNQYDGLPGDISNATKYWGTASACPGISTDLPVGNATCDGNANDAIFATGTSAEPFRAWQQLAAAGLVNGRYPGVTGPAHSAHFYPGFNSPKSKYGSEHGYWFYWLGGQVGTVVYFDGEYGTPLMLQRGNATASNAAAVRPDDQWSMDIKMDDGKPASGFVRGTKTINCTTTAGVDAEYNISYDGLACSMIYITGM